MISFRSLVHFVRILVLMVTAVLVPEAAEPQRQCIDFAAPLRPGGSVTATTGDRDTTPTGRVPATYRHGTPHATGRRSPDGLWTA